MWKHICLWFEDLPKQFSGLHLSWLKLDLKCQGTENGHYRDQVKRMAS